MSLPEFDPTEQYLIDYVKRLEFEKSPANTYMWSYVISSAIVIGCGACYQSMELVLCGVAILYGFRIYEERYGQKLLPAWLSIIKKYEAALAKVE